MVDHTPRNCWNVGEHIWDDSSTVCEQGNKAIYAKKYVKNMQTALKRIKHTQELSGALMALLLPLYYTYITRTQSCILYHNFVSLYWCFSYLMLLYVCQKLLYIKRSSRYGQCPVSYKDLSIKSWPTTYFMLQKTLSHKLAHKFASPLAGLIFVTLSRH